jgi:hypothetical protein
MKRFKILCEKGILPLLTAMREVSHIMGIVSIFGGDVVLNPAVIMGIALLLLHVGKWLGHAAALDGLCIRFCGSNERVSLDAAG